MKLFNFFKNRVKLLFFVGGIALISGGGFVGYQWYTSTHEDLSPLSAAPEEVRGKIVTLRKLKESYFIDYHNAFSRDVRQGIEFPEYIDLDYTIRYLKYEMDRDKAGKQLGYCIFDNKDNKLVGFIDIRELDSHGQFGCWLNERYRGGGRIQEAVKLIANVYFRVTNEQSFLAHVRLWNKRSCRALLKAGFVDTGKLYYEDDKPTRFLLEYRRHK